VTVSAHSFSRAAAEKIAKAGGKTLVVGSTPAAQ
jgi:ribosomal protein L18E